MRAVDQDREGDLEDRGTLENTLQKAEREVFSAERSRKADHRDRIALTDNAVHGAENVSEEDADQAPADIRRQSRFFMQGL